MKDLLKNKNSADFYLTISKLKSNPKFKNNFETTYTKNGEKEITTNFIVIKDKCKSIKEYLSKLKFKKLSKNLLIYIR